MPLADTSDQVLLEAWRAGDQHAGSALFQRHYASIYRFFMSKLPHAAEDLVQRTFLGCLEAKTRFRGEASLRTFLFGIAHNVLRMHLRHRSRAEVPLDSSEISAADLDPGPSEALGHSEERRLLLRALRHIPLDHQIVLELHYWEHLSASEIAVVTETPLGTVKTRLRRGRQLLQERIRELASSPALRESTIGGFDTWIRELPADLVGS